MDEIIIKKDKFESSMNKLEEISNNNDIKSELPSFLEKNGQLKKKITGSEMCEYSLILDKNFIDINQKFLKYYNQLKEIYKALESSDKEYISGIVNSFEKAAEACKKAEDAQKEINKIVEQLQITVEKLVELKKTSEILESQVNEYKEQKDKLEEQLNICINERKKNTINFRICYITTAIMCAITITFIFLFLLNVI